MAHRARLAGAGARLRLAYTARDVYVVLGGRGTVRVLVDGAPAGVLHVDGDRLYTAAHRRVLGSHLLELRLSPGLQAYSFTFG